MPIEARIADITTLAVDAIVNAANADLAPGGGVCGAIHRAAGPRLAAACAAVGGCPTGEARITPGFDLARPIRRPRGGPPLARRRSARGRAAGLGLRASLDLARDNGLRSIAFPAISTGIYGYPLDQATHVAVATIGEALLAPGSVERVVFACFSARALVAYAEAGVAVPVDGG